VQRRISPGWGSRRNYLRYRLAATLGQDSALKHNISICLIILRLSVLRWRGGGALRTWLGRNKLWRCLERRVKVDLCGLF
jgi:hypothetical protein